MDYKKNYNIKPKYITTAGSVIFTDGTNEVVANQKTCEAYGYQYDAGTGTCQAFSKSRKIERKFKNEGSGNRITGRDNTVQTGESITMNGRGNNTVGYNRNCIVSGEGNSVEYGINNTTVLGAYGTSIMKGSFVLGGGGSTDVNRFQSSIIHLTTTTTDNTATNMTIHGDGSNYIKLNANSIVGLEIYLTRLETGGSSGTAGNFSYRHMKGVVRCDNTKTLTITTYNSRVLGKDGVNGTASISEVGARQGNLTIQVTDRNNVNNTWNAVIYLHETTTNVSIS